MYLLRSEGYSKNVNNTNTGVVDYVEGSSNQLYTNTNNGDVDYLLTGVVANGCIATFVNLGYLDYVPDETGNTIYNNTNDGSVDYLNTLYSNASISVDVIVWNEITENWELITDFWEQLY